MAQWCIIIINWKGLKVYNVRSPLDISTKLDFWLPRALCGRPSTSEKCVISIFYSIELRGRWVGRIFTVNSEYSTYYSSLFGPNNK